MRKFTFHVPTYNHDSVEVEAEDLEQASRMLNESIQFGTIAVSAHNIDDTEQHHAEDAWDCPAFDEQGEQIR